MKRPLLIALLAFGTVAGYTSGFHHLRSHHLSHCRTPAPTAVIAPPQAAAPTQPTTVTCTPAPTAAAVPPPVTSGPE